MPAAKYSLKQPTQKNRFKQSIQGLPATAWTEKSEQYCDYRLDGKAAGGWLRAKQFANGTLYLEASTEALLAQMTQFLGAPVVVAPAGAGSPSATRAKSSGLLDVSGTYIGTDESGKGDFFGPLVVAGVLVTDQTAAILKELGVMDSKKLTAGQIGGAYREILNVVGEAAVSVMVIGPAKYNELYQRLKNGGKNLNHLLAWGHATVIENLLTAFPDCRQAIADQFGNERYIQAQLKEKGQGITLRQTPRAEANIGVAAASIVARYRFTETMGRLSEQFGVDLPLGAGAIVKVKARAFIRQHGRERLHEVVKLHFKTTQEL